MKKYEYIRLKIDMGDLSELNDLSSVGFRVVGIVRELDKENYVLLERELP